MPETKIWDHFSIQIYPLLVGNMASETTFGHWKVVFSWGKGRKMTFSQNPLKTRFWASGFWMSILSSANFKKDPPWNIFSLSVHAPATSAACCEKTKITMLCLTTPAWMQTDPDSTCGGLDDSLTEKRRDSHIFPGPEIHYTVTRTARTVMVNMFRNTETLEQTNQGKQYLSMTTTFLPLNQLYAPHPT